MLSINPIGFVHSCFKEKFGIPRQPGLAPSSRGKIVMASPFDQEEAFSGLEGVSHIWVQFIFHQSLGHDWQPKVRPPRLGGNQTIGVFASRSPFRPNSLGLSVVRYLGISREQNQLCVHISGHDLLDQTPVVDIKPYVPYVDQVPSAHNAFAPNPPELMPVHFSEEAVDFCLTLSATDGIEWRQLIVEVLQQDPRPAYHHSLAQNPTREGRMYGCRLYDHNIRWTVRQHQNETVIEVVAIEACR